MAKRDKVPQKLIVTIVLFNLQFEDKASDISLIPRTDDNMYCPGETLRVTFSSNPEPKQFIWRIWNGTAWEVRTHLHIYTQCRYMQPL